MAQNDKVIQLGSRAHSIPWQDCKIKALRNRVVVEMLPEETTKSGLVLPVNCRRDMGVVLAVPSVQPKFRGRRVPYPERGTVVCVAPYDGDWIEGADLGAYTTDNQVRVYGAFQDDSGEPQYSNWWDSIPCEVTDLGLRPYIDKILVRLDPKVEKEGQVLLSDWSTYRNGMGTVESVGPYVPDLKAGDRVCVSLKMLSNDGLGFDLDANYKDLFVCPEHAILYVCEVAA